MHQRLWGLWRRKWFFAGWDRLGSFLASLLVLDIALFLLVARLAMGDRPRMLGAFKLVLAAVTFVLVVPATMIVIQEEFKPADLLTKLGHSRRWRVAIAAITTVLLVGWGVLAATGRTSSAQTNQPSPAPVPSAALQIKTRTPTSPTAQIGASFTSSAPTQTVLSPTRIVPTIGPSSTATRVPPTATAVPPTATSVPPTATAIPSTATRVPPTATAIPSTATRVPPTATAVPPTATRVPPTATALPPTATFVPPTATSMPPTATSAAPTATTVPPTATGVPSTATPSPQPIPTTETQARVVGVLVEANDLLVEALANADELPAELLGYYCGEEAWQKASSFLIQMARRYGTEVIASYTVDGIQAPEQGADDRWQLVQSEAWTYKGEAGKTVEERWRYTYYLLAQPDKSPDFCIDDYTARRLP